MKGEGKMKRKRIMLLGSVLGIMVVISTMGLIRTAHAECTCACVWECSDQSCYATVSGDNVAHCITCVSQCCATAKKKTRC